MADAYQPIAEILHRACPSGYSRAWVKAEVGDDWSDKQVWCELGDKTMQPDMESIDSFNLGIALRTARVTLTPRGQKPWSHCTFTLFPTGKFDLQVEYD